jgi:tetratricopeptide (TPR) repeat protein
LCLELFGLSKMQRFHFRAKLTLALLLGSSLVGANLAAALVSAPLQARRPSDVSPDPLQHGLHDLHVGKFIDAANLLGLAVRSEPRNRVARCALGQALVETNRIEEATSEFRTCAQLARPDAEVEYELGEAYLRLALQLAAQILNRDSSSPYARRIFAENYIAGGDWKDAEKQYRLALAAQPHELNLAFGLGSVYLHEGSQKEAVNLYHEAVTWDPESCMAHYRLAEAAFLGADVGSTLAQLRAVQRLNPEFLANRSNFPDFPIAAAKFRSSCNVFQALVTSSSSDPALRFILGACSPPLSSRSPRALNSGVSRESTFRRLSSSDARNGDAFCASGLCDLCREQLAAQLAEPASASHGFIALGECAFEMGHLDSAFGYFQKAQAEDHNNLSALYWTQECARRLAGQSFEKIAQIAPGSYFVHLLNAQTWEERQNPELAIREYRLAIEQRPDAVLPRILVSHLEWRWLRFDAALADLRKALAMTPWDPMVNYLIGDCLVQEQQPRQALPYLNRAVTLRPGFLDAEASLGRALARLGNLQEAASDLEKVASADRDGSIHYELFRVYLRMGRKDLAARDLALAKDLSARPAGSGLNLDGPLPP